MMSHARGTRMKPHVLILLPLALTACQPRVIASAPVEIVGVASASDYIAEGTEPTWQLVIDSRITLTYDREGRGGPGSIRNYFYPLVTPADVNGVRRWQSSAG